MTAASAALTIEAARRDLGLRLKAAGIESPELDARLLVGAALDLDLTALVAQSNKTLSPNDAARLAAFAERRLAGEPVARIIGEKEFWGLRFKLAPNTLVPRPDTETVVEAALDFARPMKPATSLRIIDIGTGSGAILSRCSRSFRRRQDRNGHLGCGVRYSETECRVAGLGEQVNFVASDYFSAVSGTFGVIVSNPPYVRTADIGS